MARWRLDLADGNGGCVSACLVGCGVEVRELGIGGTARVDPERVGVGAVESFDERFRGKYPAADGAGFDPRRLVHFVAEGGDFAATSGEDSPDVQGRTPVEPEP